MLSLPDLDRAIQSRNIIIDKKGTVRAVFFGNEENFKEDKRGC